MDGEGEGNKYEARARVPAETEGYLKNFEKDCVGKDIERFEAGDSQPHKPLQKV